MRVDAFRTILHSNLTRIIKPSSFSIYFFIICIEFLKLMQPSFAEDLPKVCDLNGNKVWYFTIGASTFEIKNPQKEFHGLVFNDNPPANKNAGPIGCKKNPQKLAEIDFSWWPINNDIQPKYPREFDQIEILKYTEHSTMPPSSDADLSNRRSQLIICENKLFFRRFNDGTLLCSNASEALNALSPSNIGKPPVNNSFDYIISENLYSTPLGEPFMTDYNQSAMNVSYLLKIDLFVRYRYSVPPNIGQIFPSYVIQVDQIFRSIIQSLNKNS